MSQSVSLVLAGNRSLAYLLGFAVLTAAFGGAYSGLGINEMRDWVLQVFGLTFIGFLTALVFVLIFSWVRMRDTLIPSSERLLWTVTGQHAAGGISTLALTYTLLGISLGISTLAEQQLTPDTVQQIIKDLTRHFSMAFMTTVVGLPIAASGHALISITARQMDIRTNSARLEE